MAAVIRERSQRDLIRDERGVTTVGMVVAITISLVLIFSGGQLYKIDSAAAEIQEVADAAALAAENEVAEFMIAVNASDAVVLSMTLLAATVYGVSIVTACVPPFASLSVKLVEVGGRIVEARNAFSERASEGLEALQRLLPYLSAANAMSIATANNEGALQASYYAVGVLVPQQGQPITSDTNEKLDELAQRTEEDIEGIREAAAHAEEAAHEANEAKERGFRYDCGNAPGYCMYERASSLSQIPEDENPFYASVDTWSFGVALKRAKRYYAARISGEAPSGSVADRASYALRHRFYRYCLERLEEEGYVNDGPDGFEGHLPKFPSTTAEMRSTPLYTECRYPITAAPNGGLTMHAYSDCPGITTTVVSSGSIAQLAMGSFIECSSCGFQVESMGNIASASTNVPNGFEHHYERMRQALEDYQDARAEMDPAVKEVHADIAPLMDIVEELLVDIGNHRIHAEPPGAAGAIAIIVNTEARSADAGFSNPFIQSSGTLGTFAAVSAATLVEDSSHENASIITSLLNGIEGEEGGAVGAARIVLDLWSGLLRVYENGQTALDDALRRGLGGVSTNTESGLGQWCADLLSTVVSGAGLEPANLKALKPVILNSGHVASASDDAFAVDFLRSRSRALQVGGSVSELFGGLGEDLSTTATDALSSLEITIAEIELPAGGGGATIPITLTLPPSLIDASGGLIEDCVAMVGSAVEPIIGGRIWE